MTYLYVLIGGGLGALGRFFLFQFQTRGQGIPSYWAILSINGLGCLLAGLLLAYCQAHRVTHPLWVYGLSMGFLGAMTTFSSMTMDVILLLDRGEVMMACVYSVLSLLVTVSFAALGFYLVQWLGIK